MSERLCPRCGAYWRCACLLDEWLPPADKGCAHDWIATVGVEHEEALPENAGVVVCRLCGLYAVGVAETNR